VTARARELFGLLPVSLLVSAGFAAVLTTRTQDVSDATLAYGAVFLGLCVLAHLFIRARLPDADPYMFPLTALLAAVGLVVIYRIDTELAREQAQWFVVGLVFFCGTIVLLRDHHVLERYRYTIAAAAIALLVMPRLPGIGAQVNGAFLAIKLGSIKFQPAEFAKLGIIVFLASYLRETGDILVRPRLRPLALDRQLLLYGIPSGLALLAILVLDLTSVEIVLVVVFVASLVAVIRERPSLKHFGPLLLVWGLAMLMLIFIRDLGSSLMFFGGFLALLYVATGRMSLVSVGSTMFLGGSAFFANNVAHVHDRVETWLDTFSTKRVVCPSTGQVTEFVNCQGYQIAQSLFAQADGGLFGQGFGRALLNSPGHGPPLLPAPHTDLIYAVITNEAGLFGAAGLLGAYLLFAYRGFKTAMLANDGFSKLLAAGLTSVFALQVFVIVGGVTRVIPLTGVTLPFVSYGGSSIVANMVLLALLLIVSDHARAERLRRGGLV
jgi:cell division protein FtsW (lipid II flippase)